MMEMQKNNPQELTDLFERLDPSDSRFDLQGGEVDLQNMDVASGG